MLYLVGDHDVLWFDVSVDDVLLVHVLDGEYDGANVELRIESAEETDFSDHIEKLHPGYKFEQEEDEVAVLERLVVPHNEWEVALFHHGLFVLWLNKFDE